MTDAAPPTATLAVHNLGHTHVRSIAVSAIVGAVAIVTLREAAPVLIPILVSLLLASALEPLVRLLVRRRIPRALAALVVYALLTVAFAGVARAVRDQADSFLADLPRAVAALQRTLDRSGGIAAQALDTVQQTATALAGARPPSNASTAPGVRRVAVAGRRTGLASYVLAATRGLLRAGGQLLAIALMTFVLLATGDLSRRKLVTLAGVRPARRETARNAVEHIDRDIQRYLQIRLLISAIVGASTAVACAAVGLNHALVWGVVAGAFNVLPYIGAGSSVALIALAAFLQFHSLAMAGAAGGLALVVAGVEGNLITPLLMSRIGELNAVAVFVGVLMWGWLWDVWGLLLAIPIMVALRAAAEHVERLRPIGVLLGRESVVDSR